MHNPINQIVKLTLLVFILLVLITGCSKGSSNPITGNTSFMPAGAGDIDTLPIIAFDGDTAIGVMGGYNLTFTDGGRDAQLVPMRTASIGESVILSGTSFFTMTPCSDCLRIDNIALDINKNIVLGMSVKHPFQKGNVNEDPSVKNRLDLDVFDLALVVKPLNTTPDFYQFANAHVYTNILKNANGYTKELAGVTGENSVLPYKICYESPNNNRFEMGTDFQPFELFFSPQNGVTFDLYLTMGYGASAKWEDRLEPTYYVPEFNRKAAWKVEVDPVSWLYEEASTVKINIYDWNHGSAVTSNFPDPNNPNMLPTSSDVKAVFIEVPGMTSAPVQASIEDSITNGWDDPLIYSATFSNENNLAPDLYTGLVKVIDSRKPGTSSYSSDTIVHSPDAGPDLVWHTISEFATYQTFDAYVVGDIFVDDTIEMHDNPGTDIDDSMPVAERQLVIYHEHGMYSEMLDIIENSNSYVIGQITDMNLIQVMVNDGIPLVDEIIYFESQYGVIYARPNYVVESDSYPEGEPDGDLPPGSAKRWHFDMVNAPDAWQDFTTGSPDIMVGIVDSGLDLGDYNDFDGFAGRVIHEQHEPNLLDTIGHGTHVTGIIGAAGHNNRGTLGMAWDVKLHPFNIDSPSFELGINWAIRNLVDGGARVINISRGYRLRDADWWSQCTAARRQKFKAEMRLRYLPTFDYCADKNVILVFAGGNNYSVGQFNDDIPMGYYKYSFPIQWYWVNVHADMESFMDAYPFVLYVSATDDEDNYADFSDRGNVQLIAAPGVNIYSSYSTDAPNPNPNPNVHVDPDGRAAFNSGTSMAAPMVSGLAALILSQEPDLPAAQVVQRIIDTADDGPDANTGRINAYEALSVGSQPVDGGNLIWAKRAGGSNDDCGYGITTLSDNSTVVAGEFIGTATFGEGEPNETTLTNTGMFIARYNPDGALIWAKRARRGSGRAITTLSDNSTVVTGEFMGTATFGEGEPNETVLTDTGGDDIFVARYNSDGTLAWAKRAGGADHDRGRSITSLSDNSVVITGGFYKTATFGLGELNETILTAISRWDDLFIACYNPDGTLAWAKQAGGLEEVVRANSISRLSDNSTIVSGEFSGTVTFGKGEPNESILTYAGGADIFIARYNPDGTLAWAKRAGGSNLDYGNGITTLSDNSTVVTGSFSGTATFGVGDPNSTILTSAHWDDIFIARYHYDGTLAWAKRAGGSNDDCGYGITTLSDNSTVVAGEFIGTATFGEGEPNETVLTSAGSRDIFIARYNPNGTFAWAKRAGGSDSDFGYGITSLEDNSTVVTGEFSGMAVFGLGETNQTIPTSAGGADIFIARFEP